MIENMQCYNQKFTHIQGTKNAIADCLSRLTRQIREAQHIPLADPILADRAKSIKGDKKQIEQDDPWVQRIATTAMRDPDYLTMVHYMDAGTELNDMPTGCDLKEMGR